MAQQKKLYVIGIGDVESYEIKHICKTKKTARKRFNEIKQQIINSHKEDIKRYENEQTYKHYREQYIIDPIKHICEKFQNPSIIGLYLDYYFSHEDVVQYLSHSIADKLKEIRKIERTSFEDPHCADTVHYHPRLSIFPVEI